VGGGNAGGRTGRNRRLSEGGKTSRISQVALGGRISYRPDEGNAKYFKTGTLRVIARSGVSTQPKRLTVLVLRGPGRKGAHKGGALFSRKDRLGQLVGKKAKAIIVIESELKASDWESGKR